MIKAGDIVWTVEMQYRYIGRMECAKCFDGYFTVKTKDNVYMEVECPICYGCGDKSFSIPVLGLSAFRVCEIYDDMFGVKKLHIMEDGALYDDLMPHLPIARSEAFLTREAAQAWLSELEKGISK